MGARVIYKLSDGTTVVKSGTFPDLAHVSKIREKIERRTGKEVIETSTLWGGFFEEQRRYYHGSPRSDLSFLRAGTYLTTDMFTALIMGMNYSGKTWSDSDLAEPYMFGTGMPKFRIMPNGPVTVYTVFASDKDIEELQYPWEYRARVRLSISDVPL